MKLHALLFNNNGDVAVDPNNKGRLPCVTISSAPTVDKITSSFCSSTGITAGRLSNTTVELGGTSDGQKGYLIADVDTAGLNNRRIRFIQKQELLARVRREHAEGQATDHFLDVVERACTEHGKLAVTFARTAAAPATSSKQSNKRGRSDAAWAGRARAAATA